MKFKYYTCDVFTDKKFGGNQLAVFPQACGINEEVMQSIAAEFNLSETVFVLPSEVEAADFKLRIFTPARELAFAGHPTVGTAFVLAHYSLLQPSGNQNKIIFEEGVGLIDVDIIRKDNSNVISGCQFTAAQLPEFKALEIDNEVLAQMLAITPNQILTDHLQPLAASCGTPFVFVPVADIATVAKSKLDMDLWHRHLQSFWAPQIYIYAPGGEQPNIDYHARMFAPSMGISEDPATGAAATALAGILAQANTLENGELNLRLEQGVEMGRPSIIIMRIQKQNGSLKSIQIEGSTVMMCEGELEL